MTDSRKPANTGPAQPAPQPEPQLAADDQRRRWRPTRRGFLIGVGATAGVLALGIGLGTPYARLRIAGALDSADGQPARYPDQPWIWFEVQPDSRIRLYLPKVEMGQGIHTSLGQVAAEELGIGWADLDVVTASTARGFQNAITSGSNSVSSVYHPLREMAASLREMLRTEAARQLQVQPNALEISGRGFAVTGNPAQRIDFGTIIANKQGQWEAPKQAPPLKDASQFTLIGQSIPRRDFEAKLTGKAVYGYDARLEGIKYGAVVRPPTIEGKPKSIAPGRAPTMAGVRHVVAEKDFGGVVADTRAQARSAADQMAVEWDPGKPWQQAELEAIVTVGNGTGVTIQDEGAAESRLREQTSLTAEYRTPFAVHAHLEAQAALADVQPDKVRVWCCTQAPNVVQAAVAKAIKVDEKKVEVIPTYLGGGFGRKVGDEAAVEAALLAQAAGVPVHVGWSRSEDMRYGYFRPPTHHLLAGRLDDRGSLTAIQHSQASGDVAFPFLPPFLPAVMGADFGAYRGATIRYNVPNRRTVAWRSPVPVRTGWWRGLGLLANTFAVESFIDELAHAAGADPVAFRLRHLSADNPSQRRLQAVIQAAADRAGWGATLPARQAHGVACTLDVDTAVAMVAEASVDAATGKIRVHKVTAAMDPGLIINPDGARAQVEGNVMWGIGSALIEEVTFKDGRVEPGNFDRYPLLTMRDAPDVEVILLESGDGKPRGVGEPPIGPVAAAIANAVFAATGKRLRQLPMNAARVQAALA